MVWVVVDSKESTIKVLRMSKLKMYIQILVKNSIKNTDHITDKDLSKKVVYLQVNKIVI